MLLHFPLPILSSSSFELFVVSFMLEDVYIGYTALALTLGLQVFSLTEATTTGRLLGPTPSVFQIKMEASRLVSCSRIQQASLPACSPQYPYFAERQAGKL